MQQRHDAQIRPVRLRPPRLGFAAASALAALALGGVAGLNQSEGSREAPDARKLYEKARQSYAEFESYIARLTRREAVKGQEHRQRARPDEIILLKHRDSPWSVYMKWLGQVGKGREGVYVKGQHDDQVHTRLAAGDLLFMPAGTRMALSPYGSLFRSASAHPITDLGIGAAIDRIGTLLAAQQRGDRELGSLEVVGPERRPEFGGREAYGIEHRLPPRLDPMVTNGGRRTYYFDPVTDLPTVIRTVDHLGKEVEYYHYDRLQPAARLDDQDFNPDQLWGRKKPAPGEREG